jgi:hypothetical protein
VAGSQVMSTPVFPNVMILKNNAPIKEFLNKWGVTWLSFVRVYLSKI